MSKVLVAALVTALLALGGAGAFGWQQHRARAQAQSDLASTRAQLAKAMGDLRGANEQAVALRKEIDEQKMQTEQLRADRDSARVLVEAEKARSKRLVADLMLMREQLAFRNRQSPGSFPAPVAVQPPRPMVIQALPAPRPQSVTSPGVQAPEQSSPVRR